jgi:hypothetical protein
MTTITSPLPQGMGSYNNRSNVGGYVTWKGSGMYSNPAAVTSGNIRPLTNNDPTNVYPTGFGLPRPLKWQYRKGTTTSVPFIVTNPENPNEYVEIDTNRQVKSSTSSSLIRQTLDYPGQFSVKQNSIDELSETTKLDKDCTNCKGIGLVTNYYPEYYLTNNPLPVCETPQNCCNEQRKALLRVRPASTNLKKNYYTTLEQYRQNRCQTYDQKVFNFYSGTDATIRNSNVEKLTKFVKPGSPYSSANLYVGNCYPNTGLNDFTEADFIIFAYEIMKSDGTLSNQDIAYFNTQSVKTIADYVNFLNSLPSKNSVEANQVFKNIILNPYLGMSLNGPSNPRGCKLVVYKPSNPQFAVQGGVSSSTRTLKLGLTTIEKNVYQNNILKGSGFSSVYANVGGQPFTPLIYKTKTSKCRPNPYYPFMYKQQDNPKTCFKNSDDYLYKTVSNLGNLGAGPTVANNGISTNWS